MLSILKRLWQEISVDFIIRLLELQIFNDKKYNIILVIICRLTKYTLYILITKRLIVEGFTILFLEYVFRPFELPDSIVSDRDNLFTNKF